MDKLLRRVAEEAGQFARVAPNAVAEETLEQRVVMGPPRFRPRAGASAIAVPERKTRRRVVVSEFGYAAWKQRPDVLHEFRKVVTVDGRRKADAEKARATLTAGIRSPEDEIRKQMLRDFEKVGLVGSASDLSPMLLLFLRTNQEHYRFAPARRAYLGAVPALVLLYEQKAGDAEMTIYEGREALHQKLAGELWVRE